ncbi:MAG: phosphoribosylformylglycinamidine synthase subunit PurQ [Pyramidobacter sp.]|nr:phosphoribosylformylglycinamidine synthase subunit PurQ [Pyramidobacter sp.]
MKTAVVVFPGSNCDQDAVKAVSTVTGTPVVTVWHQETSLPDGTDLVVLPGGFSYGDYLRCGAMAANSAIMSAVKAHAARGGLVIGICNGFQILTETHLLPGALLMNDCMHFLCKTVALRIERDDLPFTLDYAKGEVINIPIAHNEGRYYVSAEELKRLEGEGRVAFRYCESDGTVSPAANPNGALNNIAGVVNERGNVLGLMPHPERYSDALLGGTDGSRFWTSVKRWLEGGSR